MTWPPAGENWEGGYRDEQGHRWVHVPNQGWREMNPAPFLSDKPGGPVIEGRIVSREKAQTPHPDEREPIIPDSTTWDGKTLTITYDREWPT